MDIGAVFFLLLYLFNVSEMENMQTHIVYISSKESYAMQLFKVQPLDFLIKPISAENIREVLIRSVKQKSSADTCFEYQKGNLETTKGDKANHGIGLKNVRRIVEKYHGELTFFYGDDSAETDVMMYVKEM